MKKVVFSLLCVVFCSCTDNARTKGYNGQMVVELPRGERLLNAGWQENDLWYLTEKMDSVYVPREKYFRAKSPLMFMEGEVIFKEKR